MRAKRIGKKGGWGRRKVSEVEGRWVGWLPGVAIATLEGFGAAHQNLGATPWLPTRVVGGGFVPPPTTSKEGCVLEMSNT